MLAFVQECGNDLAVLCWLSEAPGPTSIERVLCLLLSLHAQWPLVQVAVDPKHDLSLGISGIHECQVLQHVVGRKHVDVLDSHRLENMLLEVVVQRHSRNARDQFANPVEIDAILPCLARLVDERLGQVVVFATIEFIQASCTIIVDQSLIEKGVPEAS